MAPGSSFERRRALANGFAVRCFLQDIDPSRNKSFQTLKLPAMSIGWALESDGTLKVVQSLLAHVLPTSTITSLVFSQVVILYCDFDFLPGEVSDQVADVTEGASQHEKFELFREVHIERGFRLVLIASVSDGIGKQSV